VGSGIPASSRPTGLRTGSRATVAARCPRGVPSRGPSGKRFASLTTATRTSSKLLTNWCFDPMREPGPFPPRRDSGSSHSFGVPQPQYQPTLPGAPGDDATEISPAFCESRSTRQTVGYLLGQRAVIATARTLNSEYSRSEPDDCCGSLPRVADPFEQVAGRGKRAARWVDMPAGHLHSPRGLSAGRY
jgi:hypothetical protein